MTQDFDLLVAIAEIAGVFVGFGALISFTRRSDIAAAQLSQIRAVVTIGLIVVVSALVPVGVGRYGVSGHDLWVFCSLIFLVLSWAAILLSLLRPGSRAVVSTQTRTNPLMAVILWLLLEVPMQVALFLVVLGVNPELDPAFYITALGLNLFQAAFVLVQLVYWQALAPRPDVEPRG